MTPRESRKLGRAEYFNLENAGMTARQILEAKYITQDGRSQVWLKEFHNGFVGATMCSDDEFDQFFPGDDASRDAAIHGWPLIDR